jgi:hypothetical protein
MGNPVGVKLFGGVAHGDMLMLPELCPTYNVSVMPPVGGLWPELPSPEDTIETQVYEYTRNRCSFWAYVNGRYILKEKFHIYRLRE